MDVIKYREIADRATGHATMLFIKGRKEDSERWWKVAFHFYRKQADYCKSTGAYRSDVWMWSYALAGHSALKAKLYMEAGMMAMCGLQGNGSVEVITELCMLRIRAATGLGKQATQKEFYEG